MRRALAAMALTLFAGPVSGQARVEVRAATVQERYSFDPGLPFEEVSELSVPVTALFRLGARTDLTLSTGFARVGVVMAETGEETVLSGVLDSEARLGIAVVPNRVLVLLTGTVPTGISQYGAEELPALQALTTDVLGFTAPALGTGGGVGGGLVAALPAGRMALGLAASYRVPLSYQPVAGLEDELRPGAELRFRAGLEGAVGARTYLRISGIFMRRGQDEVNGELANGIGNRYAGYLTLDQGIGSSTLTLYGFDLFRADPQVEQTVVGAAFFPRSNVIGVGTQLALPVSRRVQLKPRAEYRGSWQELEVEGATLERMGSSLRFGADLRYTPSPYFSIAVQGDGLTGDVPGEVEENVGVSGFRFGLQLEIRR